MAGVSNQSSFRTDADISGNLPTRERTLQPWAPPSDSGPDLSLESAGNVNAGLSGQNKNWDQFEANERLYGVKSDYDENIYTTAIDRSSPLYKQREAAAEKIAREIEASNTFNAHVAEERGYALADDSGVNEEEKYAASEVHKSCAADYEQRYSGVDRASAEGLRSNQGNQNKYTPPARRAPAGAANTGPANKDPAIISSQIARTDSVAAKASDEKAQKSTAQQGTLQSTTVPVSAVETPSVTTAAPAEPTSIPTKPAIVDRTRLDANQKYANSNTSPFKKVPGESATATVENDVRDAFKQFASTEKMRFQERRRNQAKHDKDIKLNDLMKFSQTFKLKTPVPRDLVPILAKDKGKQEEIWERAQRLAKEAKEGNQGAAAHTQKSTGALTDTKTQRPLVGGKHDPTTGSGQSSMQDRHGGARNRNNQGLHMPTNQQSARQSQPQNLPMQAGRHGQALSQRLTNLQQNRAQGSHPGVPSPLPLHDNRVPPLGPAATNSDVNGPARHNGAPTPTSATSSHFNARAEAFRPNPAAVSFTPTGEPSVASSPRSAANGVVDSRVPSPSDFFGSKQPLPASERPSVKDFFNPIERLRKEATESKEEWASNGGIRPAHKTAPRWEVSEENKDKTYLEMFERVTFSTQAYSPQPPYPTPHLPYQHQLPAHLQQSGPAVPPNPAPHHQVPHHLQSQPHHHHMSVPPHFEEHRLQMSSPSSLLNSPRLQTVGMAYQSPVAQHAHLVYGPQAPQYGMAHAGPQMAQLRQFPGGPQFVAQHAGHISAPMMAHSPSGGPLMGIPQGIASPYNHHMQMYTPNPMHAYPHHAGPPAPQPGSNSFPSPGRAAPMMIHQGSQQGQPAHQMMMFGMSPGQQSQHLYVPQQPGQGTFTSYNHSGMFDSGVEGPVSRAGYMPPQQPHFGVVPHGHHIPAHHRGGHGYGHPPHPPPSHVVAQQTHPSNNPHVIGVDGDEEVK